MQIEEITDFEAFVDLQESWDDLCRQSGANSFFLSHAWFRCCWLGKAESERPFVVVVRDMSGVVGLAPFFANTMNWRIFPVHTASLMHNQESPFADVILAAERAGKILQTILDYLRRSAKPHIVSFNKIPRFSSTHELLANSGKRAPLIRALAARSPVLQLDGDWDGFWATQSQRFKKTVRNVANRIERLGGVTVAELSAAASAEECLQVFASVADRSWKARLAISPSHNPNILRFFEVLTSELHGHGRLLLWALSVDGNPIATEYHVDDGDTIYALRSDFDDSYREASPGAYLNDRIVRTYFERKVRTYDMGPGENPYKRRWATGAKEFDDFSFFNRRPYPLTIYTMERHAVPRLRRARHWWRGSCTTTARRVRRSDLAGVGDRFSKTAAAESLGR